MLGLRGMQKTQNLKQQELATVDVGCVIAIMLNMESNHLVKHQAIQNAARKMLVEDEVKNMVYHKYKTTHPNFEVSMNCNAPGQELVGQMSQLAQTGDFFAQFYGYQLYWVLSCYFKAFSIVVGKKIPVGSTIDSRTINQGLIKVKHIEGYAKHAAGIDCFGRLVARVCGIFLDKDEDAIAEGLYRVIVGDYES